jgi:uroporphyrinogen decarboxylase
MEAVLEKSTAFLTAYARAFKEAGAAGLVMAEPAAGLLSPRGLSTHSSAYVKRIAAEVSDGEFGLILHNCAARLLHLPAILETGLNSFHFGAPMDLPAALGKVAPDVVLCGNLDPTAVLCQLAPAEVRVRALELLAQAGAHRNFVLSSGCDVPAAAPLANLAALYAAVKGS